MGQASGGNESVQVVIVGAGISGLVAAWELRKRGVTDVLVLEMDDAPGGNARSGYDGPGGDAWSNCTLGSATAHSTLGEIAHYTLVSWVRSPGS